MATYYVSSSYTGSVSNGGQTTPWKTLSQVQSAMSSFQAGDAIRFKCGDTFSGTLTVNKSGTALAPITFGSYGDGVRPKFIGTGSVVPYLIYSFNRSYIIFDNLWITDPTMSPTDRTINSKIQRAFTFDGTSSGYITINNCKIELVGVAAYWITGYNTMSNCEIGNLRMVVNTNDGPPPGRDDDYGANPLVVSSSNNTITGNYFYDCYAQSYDYGIEGGAREFYNRTGPITNNIIKFNTFVNTGGIFEITANASDNEFAYNKVINVGAVVYMQNGFTLSRFRFNNNVFVESATPTIPSDINGRLFAGNLSSGSIILRNNVFNLYNGTRVATTSVIDHQYNVFKVSNNSTVGFPLNGTEVLTSATLFTNTSNVNPYFWDFRPADNSILINVGTNLGYSSDFSGNTVSGNPDIGVLEYQSVNPPPAPLGIQLSGTPITFFGGTSNITVSASGGTPPYTGTGVFTRSAGFHEFNVTDADNSIVTDSIQITQPNQLLVSASYTPITLINGTTSVTLRGNGGITPYKYSIDNVTFVNGNVFSGLTSGTYTFYIQDAVSATTSSVITISGPASTFAIRGLTVRTKNGKTPITYSIDNGAYTTNATFNNLNAGQTYTIRAKDGSGVIKTMTLTITP